MKRILFVDDEPQLLEGLRRSLRSQRKEWDMAFASGGAEALELLAARPFDVVVTDMRMPVMDGSRLLECVRERFPGVIRIVLSGYFETEMACRAVPVAHQFLAKPCDPDKLREAIDRSCGFTSMLRDEVARRVVSAVGQLPSLPSTCASLMEALRNPDVPIEEVGRIVEHDVGMAAKVLQLVNSAYFAVRHEVTDIRMAVAQVGLDTLKQLVLSVEIFRTFQPARHVPGFSLAGLQKHSHLAAAIAGRLPARKTASAAGVVAALLHDAGKLVLAVRLPDRLELALKTSFEEDRPLHAVEEELTGAGHAEIGAYLLGLWGLPEPIVDAVYRHHSPTAAEGAGGELDVLAIAHIADALAFEQAGGTSGDAPARCNLWNREYVAALGVAGEIPVWREMARQMAQDGGS